MKRQPLVFCGRRMKRVVQDHGRLVEHVLRWGHFRFVVRHYQPGSGLTNSSLPFQARVDVAGTMLWYRFCASEATALRQLGKQVRSLAGDLALLAKEIA